MTRKSVEELAKKQQAESTARQQDELIRNIAVQASFPEEALRRLIPPTVQVPTDGTSQVVEANNSELGKPCETHCKQPSTYPKIFLESRLDKAES